MISRRFLFRPKLFAWKIENDVATQYYYTMVVATGSS